MTDFAERLKEAIDKAFEKATESMLRSFDEFSWEHQTTATKKRDAEVEARKIRNDCARNSEFDKEEMIDVEAVCQLGYAGKVFDRSTERVLEEHTDEFVKYVETRKGVMTGARDNRPGMAPLQWNTPTGIYPEIPSHINSHFNCYDKSGKGTDVGGYGEVGTSVWGSYKDGGSGGGPGHGRVRTPDIPRFDGNDSDWWVMRVESVFSSYCMSEEEMLEAVVMVLGGDALQLYQWENNRRPFRCWNDLKGVLLRQFRSANYHTVSYSYGGHGGYVEGNEFSDWKMDCANKFGDNVGVNKSVYYALPSCLEDYTTEGCLKKNDDGVGVKESVVEKECTEPVIPPIDSTVWDGTHRLNKVWEFNIPNITDPPSIQCENCIDFHLDTGQKGSGSSLSYGQSTVTKLDEGWIDLAPQVQTRVDSTKSIRELVAEIFGVGRQAVGEEHSVTFSTMAGCVETFVDVAEESVIIPDYAHDPQRQTKDEHVLRSHFLMPTLQAPISSASPYVLNKDSGSSVGEKNSGTVVKDSGTVIASCRPNSMEWASGKDRGGNGIINSGLYMELPGDVVVKELGFGSCLHTIYTSNLFIMLMISKELKPPKNVKWVDKKRRNFDPGGGTITAISVAVHNLCADTFGIDVLLLQLAQKIYQDEMQLCAEQPDSKNMRSGQRKFIRRMNVEGIVEMIKSKVGNIKSGCHGNEHSQTENDEESDQIPSLWAEAIGIYFPAPIAREVMNHATSMLGTIIGQVILTLTLTATGRIIFFHMVVFITTFDPGGCKIEIILATFLSDERGKKVPELSQLNANTAHHGLKTTIEILKVFILRNITKDELREKEVETLTPTLRTRSFLGGGVMLCTGPTHQLNWTLSLQKRTGPGPTPEK